MAVKKNVAPEPEENEPGDETEDLLNELAEAGVDEGDLLDEVPETDAQPWIPEEEGEGIEGVVVEKDEIPDQFAVESGEQTYPMLIIRDKDDELWAIHGMRSGLRREIKKRDPQVGDLFAVKYLGERELRKGKFAGKPFHLYRSAVRRKSQAA